MQLINITNRVAISIFVLSLVCAGVNILMLTNGSLAKGLFFVLFYLFNMIASFALSSLSVLNKDSKVGFVFIGGINLLLFMAACAKY
jgi:hypothetical protein|tara:strand:+ start:1544 stop:1804 length:261 start_codon:yes stop_codon:yes gene_type:complete